MAKSRWLRIQSVNRVFALTLTVEMQREIAQLSRLRFVGPRELVESAAKGLFRRIRAAHESGILPCFLGLEIPFVGYFNGDPFCLNAEFFPTGHYQVIGQALDGWLFMFSGSQIIANLMQEGDKRIGCRIKVPDDQPLLNDAIEATRAYIEACSSQWALEVDPKNCRGLGGHIHIAIVTPPVRVRWFASLFGSRVQMGGFEWVIPPK